MSDTITKARVLEGSGIMKTGVALAALPFLFSDDPAERMAVDVSAKFIEMIEAFEADLRDMK